MKLHERSEHIKSCLASAQTTSELKEIWVGKEVQDHLKVLRAERMGTYNFLVAHKEWLKNKMRGA